MSVCRHELGHRQFGFNSRAAPQVRVDPEAPAQAPDPFLHAEQAQAADEAGVKTCAVIADRQEHPVFFASDHHLGGAGVGVAAGVVHGLLDQAVNASLVLVGQIVGGVIGLHHQADSTELRDILKDYPDYKLTIEGHCDERGSAEYNLALGDARAKAAKDYLVQVGIPGDQLSIISYGKERPVCQEHDEACGQKNRRIHIVAMAASR